MRAFFLIATIILSAGLLPAQKISVGYVYPAGVQRGTTAEVTVGGMNVGNATSVYVSGKGVKAEIVKNESTGNTDLRRKRKKLDDQSSPQLADKLVLRVTVDKNALPGLRDLRLESVGGVSNKLNFEVGQYPDFLEKQGSSASNPNLVSGLPTVLCGQILPGERDFFRFSAKKGEIIVAAVKGRALVPFIADAVPGWFQPVISIRNSAGNEVAYCDDYKGQVDPVIVFHVPANDDYTLEIHDAIYRGREDFNYRIELGEIPFVFSAVPVVIPVNKKTAIKLTGVNLKSDKVSFKVRSAGDNSLLAEGKNGGFSGPVHLFGVSNDKKIFNKANLSADRHLNQYYYDSIDSQNVKEYTFQAEAGESAVFELLARRLGSQLDGRLRLLDAKGNLLAESDDSEDEMQGLMTFHADPKLNYKFSETAEYKLQVEDVLRNSGSDYFYLLRKENRPDPFRVFVSPAILSIPQGGTALITVNVEAKEKPMRRLNLEVEGLPSGSIVSNLIVPAGAKKKDISVTLPDKCKIGDYDLKLKAVSEARGDAAFSQEAVAADDMMQAFYYHHNIPAAGFSLKVAPQSPFKLKFPDELLLNNEYKLSVAESDSVFVIPVEIIRKQGFVDPIELSVYPKSKLISVQNSHVLPSETTKDVRIIIRKSTTKTGFKNRFTLAIVGTVKGEVEKKGKRTYENASYREMTPLLVVQNRANVLK